MKNEVTSIVLIEDDEDDYLLTRDLLEEIERGNFNLQWVANYEDALKVLRGAKADVYLVDYRLGQHNGLELLQEALFRGVRAPIILLTGQGNRELDLQAMEAGASDYLVKGEINSYLLERTIRYAIERRQSEEQLERRYNQLQTIYNMTASVGQTSAIDEIYQQALVGLQQALGAERAAISLFDDDGALRYKAWDGLSVEYRQATEKHYLWVGNENQTMPILVPDISREPLLDALAPAMQAEGINAMAFIPLMYQRQLVGQITLYYDQPHMFSNEDLNLARTIANNIVFALERTRSEADLREAEERYRTLVEQAPVVTYREEREGETSRTIYVSPQIEALLGFTPAEWLADPSMWINQVFPADRERVLNLVIREYSVGKTFDAEYRMLTRDGQVKWIRDNGNIVDMGPGLPKQLHGVMADVTARKVAEEAEREQRVLIEALLDTADSLNQTLNLDEVLTRILSNVGRVAPYDAANIVLMDGEFGYVARSVGYDQRGVEEKLNQIRWRLADTPLMNSMLTTGQPMVIADTRQEADWVDLQGLGWQRSYIGVPIRSQGQIIGLLNLDSEQPGVYLPQHSERLKAFADQASVAIQNSGLYANVRSHAARTEALANTAARLNADLDLESVLSAVSEEVAKALQAPVGQVFLYESQKNVFRLRATSGLAEKYRANHIPVPRARLESYFKTLGEPTEIPDLLAVTDSSNSSLYAEFELRTTALAVMMRTGRMVGALAVMQTQTTRHFTENELALLQGLANQAVQAIANAQLFAETQQRLERLKALQAIDTAITSSLDLNLTLTVLIEQVTLQLGVDAADVLILDSYTHTLNYAAGRGLRAPELQRTRLMLGQGHAGQAALDRRTVHVADLLTDSGMVQRSQFLNAEGFVSYYGAPLIAKGQAIGVLEVFSRRRFEAAEEWLDFLETLAGQAAIAIDDGQLFDSLQRSNMELMLAYDATIEGWSRALDLRDKETEGHTQRVTDTTVRLAQTLGLSDKEIVHIRRGALLHDIGKMGVPDSILLKPGPLTDAEWVIMRQHPVYAYEMLAPIAYLRPALDIPYCHHEKWDGSGYPRGLKGEQIPLSARLFAVIDVWDALRSDRPYRAGWPVDKVRDHIRSLSGTHFDPTVVSVFLNMI